MCKQLSYYVCTLIDTLKSNPWNINTYLDGTESRTEPDESPSFTIVTSAFHEDKLFLFFFSKVPMFRHRMGDKLA